jgi:hypothetical protein
MPIPENNTIIAPDTSPDEIQKTAVDKVVSRLDATMLTSVEHPEQAETQLLGLSTDEQRVMVFIRLHNPDDKFFLNWSNIYSLGELYCANYKGDDYRAYQNKLKLLTAKYYNPKKYTLQFDSTQIRAFPKDPKSATYDTPHTKPIDTLDKPVFMDTYAEIKNGYIKISQMRTHLEHNYKFLYGLPYVEPVDKKKFVKLRNNFTREINAYYTHMYYFNRVNNHNMTEKEITLPTLSSSYSETTNEMLPRIDKVTIRLSEDIITQKYNNDAAKLELFLAIKQKMHEQHSHPKDKKIHDELQKLLKEYIEFDKLYQSKLITHISQRKNKKIITDMIIFSGQPLPGDGAVVNPNEGLDDTAPSTTSLSALGTAVGIKKHRQSGGSSDLDSMDEKERNRKFFFINRAKRANGDLP